MHVYRGLPNPASRTPCVLSIGNFDGVHRGHQALLARVRANANEMGVAAAVMTFEPQPREYFARKAGEARSAPPRISNLRDKLEALATNGIDRVIVEHFSAPFAALTAERFIDEILIGGCRARAIVVGHDFRFGARRAGNWAMLEDAGRRLGFYCEQLAPIQIGNERVSSSAVRAALAQGNLKAVENLLGRRYSISGHVVPGKRLGRTIGFPTLNLRIAHGRPALTGVFIVNVYCATSEPRPGVASVGARPTVDDSGCFVVEAHLFDFAQNLYGCLVRVEFLEKLRDERKYPDLAALTEAIAQDARRARAFFGDALAESFVTSATDRII